jgi:hypothetical protein
MVRRGIVIPAFEEVMAPELKNEGPPLTETGDVPIPPAVESPRDDGRPTGSDGKNDAGAKQGAGQCLDSMPGDELKLLTKKPRKLIIPDYEKNGLSL